MEESTKMCGKCHRVLPLSAFYNNASKPDGKSSYCKECMKEVNMRCKDNARAKGLLPLKKKSTNPLEDADTESLVAELIARGKKVFVDPKPRDLISELCSLGFGGELKYVEVHTVDVASFNKRNNV